MTTRKFLSDIYNIKVEKAGAGAMEEFAAYCSASPDFKQVVRNVCAISKSFYDTHKIGVTVDAGNLPQSEQEIYNFFRDHSFSSTQDQRNFADLISLVTGVNASRYIKASPRLNRFETGVVVMPARHSSNGHSYKLGEPVIAMSNGTVMTRANGSHGNNLTLVPDELTSVNDADIESFLEELMWQSNGHAEMLMSLFNFEMHMIDGKLSNNPINKSEGSLFSMTFSSEHQQQNSPANPIQLSDIWASPSVAEDGEDEDDQEEDDEDEDEDEHYAEEEDGEDI